MLNRTRAISMAVTRASKKETSKVPGEGLTDTKRKILASSMERNKEALRLLAKY